MSGDPHRAPSGGVLTSSFTPSWTSSLVIPDALASVLRPHQVDALHFVWHRIVDEGLLRMAARSSSCTLAQRLDLYHQMHGCVLGHSMGLGKTLTSVAFVLLLQAQLWLMTLKRSYALGADVGGSKPSALPKLCRALRVLVLCPLSCVSHWQQTMDEWVRPELFGRVSLPTYVPSASTSSMSSSMPQYNAILTSYYKEGGILIMGYEEFIHYAQHLVEQCGSTATPSKQGRTDRVWSALDAIRARVPLSATVTLLDMLESADVLVLDEAHRLRTQSSVLMRTLSRHLCHTQLRLAVTGTPIQNHLEDYNVMQSVVTGRLLDTKKFHKYFVAPIERGQCSDASLSHFREMQRCVASLRLFFADTVHHCGPELLEAALPPRHEHVFFFNLSATQDRMYRRMQKHFAARMVKKDHSVIMLSLYHQSSHLCLHPCLVTIDFDDAEKHASPLPVPSSAEGRPQDGRRAQRDGQDLSESENADSVDDEVADGWAASTDVEIIDVSQSPKLTFTLALVRHIVHDRREKVVVYSRYISHVMLVCALVRRDLQVEPLVLTGARSNVDRRASIAAFNDDTSSPVMVASVGAGGVGIKLTAANHCLLLDVGWNPANDAQATYRIFRFGQTRPVYIYRLAGFGTCEHVVFAYALQKSWLHRKLADAADPARHAQHVKQNYLVYPCRIPLEGDDTPATRDETTDSHNNYSEEAEPAESAQAIEARGQRVLARCDAGCQPAAAVLRQVPRLLPSVQTVVPHSFLLRDTTDEVVSAMSARFAGVEQKTVTQKASVVVPPVMPAAPVARPTQSLLDVCESAVAEVAHEAANYCILRVIQHHEAERIRKRQAREASGHDSVQRGDPHEDAAAHEQRDSAAVVRTTDEALRRALSPLLPDALPIAMNARLHDTAFLAETLLAFYVIGVHAVAQRLTLTPYAKVRTVLASRIPFDGRRRHHDSSQHGILAETLSTRPSRVFGGMRPTEETYIYTELGFTRPFVKQCIVLGLLQSCFSPRARELGEESRAVLTALFADNMTTSPPASEPEMVDGEEALGPDMTLLPVTLMDSHASSAASLALCRTLSAFFDDLWPPFVELAAPSLPIDVYEQRRLTDRAGQAAQRTPWSGFLSLKEVSVALRLAPYQGRADQLACGRCRGAFLRRRGPTQLSCPLCHYNAEFEAANLTAWYHPIFLFRHAVLCHAIESLSLTRCFAEPLDASAKGVDGTSEKEDTPESRVVARLQHLAVPSRHGFSFVDKCLAQGVEATLKILPTSLTRLLSLQCGCGLDEGELQAVLVANAHLVWSSSVRGHVKKAVTAALHRAVGLGPEAALPGGSSMPLMLMVVGLFCAAQTERVQYAHDLLQDATARSPRHTLLRFVCDAVVKLIFLSRLETVYAEERKEAKARLDANSDAASSASVPSIAFVSDASDDDAKNTDGHAGPLSSLPSLPAYVDTDDDDDGDDDSDRGLLPMPLKGLQTAHRVARPGQKRARVPGRSQHSVRRRWDLPSSSRSTSPFGGSPSSSGSSRSPSFALCSSLASDSDSAVDSKDSADRKSVTSATGSTPSFHTARVNAYWMAYCEVYGTESVEQAPVYIDEGTRGLTLLPAPPSSFWNVHMSRLPGEGMEMSTVIDRFYKHILPLSRAVGVIE